MVRSRNRDCALVELPISSEVLLKKVYEANDHLHIFRI